MKRRESSGFPPARPSIAMLMACRSFIAETLLLCGIMKGDLDDVIQIVLFAAWRAIAADRYRPDPAADPSRSFRSWIMGIAWRQATHWREMAHRRREVLIADPWSMAPEPSADPPDADLAEVFLAISALPPWAREVLMLAADGLTPTETAAESAQAARRGADAMRIIRRRSSALAGRAQ